MWVGLAPFFGNTIDSGRHSLWMLGASFASKPTSHVQRGSLAFCQPEAPKGRFRGGQEAKVVLGSSVCPLALVYGAAASKNMERESFGATFCSIPYWWMILICNFVPKNREVFGKYPCTTQAVSRCTIFRAASVGMKVPKAPLILQLGCVLTLVIQLATRAEKPHQFHPWETAEITWDR